MRGIELLVKSRWVLEVLKDQAGQCGWMCSTIQDYCVEDIWGDKV